MTMTQMTMTQMTMTQMTMTQMTMTRPTASRRWFLRSTTGAALAALAMGAQALFGATPASARASCCSLAAPSTAWCPMLCAETAHRIRCWRCNNNGCRCCECTSTTNCFDGIVVCSYEIGCCG